MLTSAFAWVVLVGLTFAPFPPEHQYNFLNPVIDPWWAVTKERLGGTNQWTFHLNQSAQAVQKQLCSPRWHKLDKRTQSAVYSVWQVPEPYLIVSLIFFKIFILLRAFSPLNSAVKCGFVIEFTFWTLPCRHLRKRSTWRRTWRRLVCTRSPRRRKSRWRQSARWSIRNSPWSLTISTCSGVPWQTTAK